jgi:flagellar protein FlgJ
MDPLINRLGQAANELAADARSLESLKRAARDNPQAALKKVASQFEALFTQMLLKSMRDAMPRSGMFDSPAQAMYTGMLDQQLAGRVAQNGTGLAEVIAKQLSRTLGAQDRTADRGLRIAPGTAAPSGSALHPASKSTENAPTDQDSAPAVRNPQSAIPEDRSSFISRLWDEAQAAAKATGIAAKFILAQAAHESGWGKGEIKSADGMPTYNLFGIKAGANWTGRTVEVVTTEYEGGVARKVVEKFRAYDSYADAFRDWAGLMTASPRYAQVVAQGRNAAGFAYGLQRAGYATDPNYGAKLMRSIGAVSALRDKA